MVVVIHRWEQGLLRAAWTQWGAVVARLRTEEIHRKAFELFERQCRHVLRWRIWQGWSAWQAHTFKNRSAAEAIKIMFACIRRWHEGLVIAAWAQWGAVVDQLRTEEIHRKAFELFEQQCRYTHIIIPPARASFIIPRTP